jgi:hypothetical protein
MRREGYQLLSMMFRSSFSRAAAYSSDSVPCPADCKNAGHLCVAGVDTRTYGTYLGGRLLRETSDQQRMMTMKPQSSCGDGWFTNPIGQTDAARMPLRPENAVRTQHATSDDHASTGSPMRT